jgi:GDPmannose 4,6-dehydratase
MKINKKIIVTGATGQDGSYMIEYLIENTQDTIIAAVRRTSQAILSNLENVLNNPRLKLVTVDLCDGEAIRKLIKEEKPDYFINFGGQTYVSDSWANPIAHMNTNALSLIYILESIREYVPNCRFYSAGSSEQWGDVIYSPQDEKHPMRPRSMYGVSKCTASLTTKVYRESYNLYAIHGVLLNHESERRQEYFVSRKISKGVARINYAIQNDQSFSPIELGNLDSKRDWSHAKDFIDGIWKMLNQFEAKEYVLSSGECHSIREFVELAFKQVGIDGYWVGNGLSEKFVFDKWIQDGDFGSYNVETVLVSINPKFFRLADVESLHGDSSLARKELNWKPKISFNQLVSIMVDHDIKNYK